MTSMGTIVKWILIVATLAVIVMVFASFLGPMLDAAMNNPFAGMFG
jgi:hypothetical protein